MTAGWRAGNALLAAACGWAFTWVIVLVWQVLARTASKYPNYERVGDLVSLMLIYSVATAAVTLGATVVFAVPYVALRSAASILGRPWRMYLEPCAVVLVGTMSIAHRSMSNGNIKVPFRDLALNAFVLFAVVTSLASSFFFLRQLRRSVGRV